MPSNEINFILNNEQMQRKFGAKLARACSDKNCVIYLQGDLGAGKTTLARGFLQGLDYHGKVKSPTYTLIEIYELLSQKIYHVDLYRIQSPEEVFSLGLNEEIYNNNAKPVIYLIEWPEKALKQLPVPDITCNIAHLENKRHCILTAHTLQGKDIIAAMKKKSQEDKKRA